MPDRLDPTDFRKNDVLLVALHEENKDRLERLENSGASMEHQLARINAALFDADTGKSNLAEVLRILNGSRFVWRLFLGLAAVGAVISGFVSAIAGFKGWK